MATTALLVSDILLDDLKQWPFGLARVTQRIVSGPVRNCRNLSAHMLLRLPSTKTAAEVAVNIVLDVYLNPNTCGYQLFVSIGLHSAGPTFSCMVNYKSDGSESLAIASGFCENPGVAEIVARFFHPFVMRFYREDIGIEVPEQIVYFDEATVEAINRLSGNRFGMMVQTIKELERFQK